MIPIVKAKQDMYGEDSPLYIELGEVSPVVTKWITHDMTDLDFPWKLSKFDLDHLIRDVCYLIYRKRQMLARQSLPITTTSMKSKPAKKVGSKVKAVNKLKAAKTAKSKRLIKKK